MVGTRRFMELCEASARMRESNDCTVKAVAVVMGVTYQAAHQALELHGRKRNRGAFSTIEAIETLGGTWVEVPDWQYRDEWGMKTPITASAALKKHLPNANVLIYYRGHISGAVNGIIHDWANGRKHHISRVIQVFRPGEQG